MLKKVGLPILLVLAIGAIVAASMLSGDRQRGGKKVYVEAATLSDISQVIKASGRIDPRVKVNISAHVIGKIEKLYVEEGDEIAAGQPFLELEDEAFVAARDQARAQLEIARSRERQAVINRERAELEQRRYRRLSEESIVSQERLEQSELAFKSAQLEVEQAKEAVLQAEALLEKAEDDLQKTTIYAPLGGRVITLNAEAGEVVVSGTMNNPASVIGTIADLSEILIEVEVDETEIVFAQIGQRAEIEVDAVPEVVYHGSVVEIGSSGYSRPQQPDVTLFKVKVLLDDADEKLRPGMTARAEIEVDTHEHALTVPIQAVVYRASDETDASGEADDREVAYVVEDGKAIERPVEVGISDATRIEITDGLSEGDLVVTGSYRVLKTLADGDRVRIEDDGAGKKGPKADAEETGADESPAGEESSASDPAPETQ